jgi:hypothetical protein
MGKNGLAVPLEAIEKAIHNLRGQRVMLSSDLAVLYGVEPRVLIQAVKRNIDRFPVDFMFQLTWDEYHSLQPERGADRGGGESRSQNVILKRGRHPKYPPSAFTEQGVAMLSSVLRSPRAIRVNIEIMRTFVRMRRMIVAHEDLADKLTELERKVAEHDESIRAIVLAIRQLMEPVKPPKRRRIGFHDCE